MGRVNLYQGEYVGLWASLPMSREQIYRSCFSSQGSFLYPSESQYEIELNLPYPIGRLVSPVEHGELLDVVCAKCGHSMSGKTWEVDPCPECGCLKVKPDVLGKPHLHGIWVFELHVLDEKTQFILGEIFDIDYDRQLRFSGKGSWHSWSCDGSGFDICHIRCLDRALKLHFVDGLTGLDLFMKMYPDEGKVLNGYGQEFKVFKYWKDGELRPVSEYFVKSGIGCPVSKT